MGRGRSRDWKDPMGTMDMAASHMDRRGDDLIRSQFMEQEAYARNICHRIHGAYLMEMDLVHRHSVGMGLGLGDQGINCLHVFLHRVWNIQTVNDGGDACHGGVMMVMMGMIMSVVAVDVFTMVMGMAVGIVVLMVVIMTIVAMSGLVLMVVIMTIVAVGMAVKPVSGNEFAGFMGMGVGVSMIMNVFALLFLPENSHIHMCSRDPAFYGRFRFHLHARQTQSVHFSKKFFLLFRTQL